MRAFVVAALCLVPLVPAQADVIAQTEGGFVVRHVAEVAAAPEEVWKQLLVPADWWNAAHTFSGDAANLAIDPRAGGCFCETLPGEGEKGWLDARGGVEHMRVVFVERNKVLRLRGSLGPLQSEAALGALTVTLQPSDGGTRLTWEYVVAGYMRYKPEQIVPAVDKVIGEQVTRLAEKLGRKALEASPKPKPGMEIGR